MSEELVIEQNITGRPISSEMEKLLGVTFPILDKGSIRVVDYMGNDASIVQMARISYGDGTKTVSEDRSLIRYLLRNQHTSPIETPVIKLHVKLPIFIMRQWVRHRTASLNEYSARYSILKDEFYIPNVDQIKPQSTTNKQGRQFDDFGMTDDTANHIIHEMTNHMADDFSMYHWLLNDGLDHELTVDDTHAGLARELSRIVLPLSTYTEMYWQVNLRNLLHFLKLRADKHAQYEIRVYAEKILDIIKLWVPMVAEAFVDYIHEAKTLSRMEVSLLQSMLAEGRTDLPRYAQGNFVKFGMTRRECDEFIESFSNRPTM